jgi:predicted MPP superfamily phosphohydrolase
LGLALASFVWGFFIEPNRLVVRRTRITIPSWPEELDGMTIALLSDLHVGAPFIDAEKLRVIVARTNDAAPDLVLLAGDYLVGEEPGSHFVEPEVVARGLSGLRARLGVYAVLGNHDDWYDGPRVRRAFESQGIRVLDNEVAEIPVGHTSLWIAGLADLMTGPQAISDTLAKAGGTVIALTHEPDVFPDIPTRVALTLAGHTHGGQVALPWIGRRVVPSRYGERYAIGLVVEDGKHLFVTPGIGTSILPVRFGVPPEISLLTIASSQRGPVGSNAHATSLNARGVSP